MAGLLPRVSVLYDARMVLSTMRVHDDLVASGMPEEQARAVVRVIEQQQDELVSKEDLKLFTAKVQGVYWRGVGVVCGALITATAINIAAMAAFS